MNICLVLNSACISIFSLTVCCLLRFMNPLSDLIFISSLNKSLRSIFCFSTKGFTSMVGLYIEIGPLKQYFFFVLLRRSIVFQDDLLFDSL
jgi:hypothetical protein